MTPEQPEGFSGGARERAAVDRIYTPTSRLPPMPAAKLAN
jgi:hypothetical protein